MPGCKRRTREIPYLALWSRLDQFEPEELEALLLERTVVRLGVQRGTVHAITADDCPVLRPLAQPIMSQQLRAHPDFKAAKPIDVEAVTAYAGDVLGQRPRTAKQLRDALAERFPEFDPAAMLVASRFHLAYVQVPPRGLWHRGGQVVGTTAEAWLGRSLEIDPTPDDDHPPLRRRLRSGDRPGRGDVVPLHRSARGVRPAASTAADVPRRCRTRAVRPA